jgi:hypothetical protein
MTSGGARNRSGPQPDPNSATSERRGLQFKLLPREGFTGRVPAFPLPKPSARERAVWTQLWRTPQAAMWDLERWRMPSIGLYCRLFVRAESPESSSSLVAQLHRLADQLGLTPAGLKENGWRMSVDEVGEKREAQAPSKKTTAAAPRRLRVVNE